MVCTKKSTVLALALLTVLSSVTALLAAQNLRRVFKNPDWPKEDEAKPILQSLESEATDIVLGLVVGIEYNEDVDATVAAMRQNRLRYKMRVLPIRVIRGTIVPYVPKEDNIHEVGITVQYYDRSLGVSGAPPGKVLIPPQPSFLCLLFLKHKKADLYELSEHRLGALPMSKKVSRAEEKDPWAMIVMTLGDPEVPKYVHDEIFTYLVDQGIQEKKEGELREAHQHYYENLLASVREELANE